ncbi:Activator of 90 kDa heat shock protein ATPase -like protein 1 [Caligus rogercresseyi]|uniref:Activator of 90 kDa heat shock protein ATPase -like protein 1 n=1 Tax=Caligus rogercresseyi TaxID=217165 RepID=A0A7T8KLE8_CALRO|nr:Activator of 90 kDa heat shock protein ATPase -like protein 1 [Caligus rogercresseyi]
MSEEHTDMADVDLEVLLEKSKGSKAQELKEMMRVGKGARVMREKLAEYVTALRNEFSKGLILPNKDNNSTAPSPTENKKSVNIKKAAFNAYNNASSASSKAGSPLQLKDCHLKETFNCSGEELYNALTQKTFLQVFFASEIKMPDVAAPGETFSFLNGNIVGEFVELVPYTKIVQKWRLKSWPQGHYSLVEISIAQAKDETQLSLSQKGIPEKELENTTQGWKGYYWIPIKRCFGYGQITF